MKDKDWKSYKSNVMVIINIFKTNFKVFFIVFFFDERLSQGNVVKQTCGIYKHTKEMFEVSD